MAEAVGVECAAREGGRGEDVTAADRGRPSQLPRGGVERADLVQAVDVDRAIGNDGRGVLLRAI
jgi:hypothetical protein